MLCRVCIEHTFKTSSNFLTQTEILKNVNLLGTFTTAYYILQFIFKISEASDITHETPLAMRIQKSMAPQLHGHLLRFCCY